jgi:hypothetical protein
MALVLIAQFYDFQAEYEGSIPFTRSNCDFNGLARNLRVLIVDAPRLKANGICECF